MSPPPDHAAIVAVARGDVAAHHAPVLGLSVSPDGGHAVVLLGSGTSPEYPFQEACEKVEGEWVGLGGSNTAGWTEYAYSDEDDDRIMRVMTDWDHAPEGARLAVLSYRGEEFEVPVVNGVYFFADWVAHADSLEHLCLARFVD